MINAKDKSAMKARLARIEGQLRGIQRLIDVDEPDCEMVVQQMAAARKAMDKAAHTMLACIIEAHIRAGEADDLADLGALISKYA